MRTMSLPASFCMGSTLPQCQSVRPLALRMAWLAASYEKVSGPWSKQGCEEPTLLMAAVAGDSEANWSWR